MVATHISFNHSHSVVKCAGNGILRPLAFIGISQAAYNRLQQNNLGYNSNAAIAMNLRYALTVSLARPAFSQAIALLK